MPSPRSVPAGPDSGPAHSPQGHRAPAALDATQGAGSAEERPAPRPAPSAAAARRLTGPGPCRRGAGAAGRGGRSDTDPRRGGRPGPVRGLCRGVPGRPDSQHGAPRAPSPRRALTSAPPRSSRTAATSIARLRIPQNSRPLASAPRPRGKPAPPRPLRPAHHALVTPLVTPPYDYGTPRGTILLSASALLSARARFDDSSGAGRKRRRTKHGGGRGSSGGDGDHDGDGSGDVQGGGGDSGQLPGDLPAAFPSELKAPPWPAEPPAASPERIAAPPHLVHAGAAGPRRRGSRVESVPPGVRTCEL